jgi:hypothetical protein
LSFLTLDVVPLPVMPLDVMPLRVILLRVILLHVIPLYVMPRLDRGIHHGRDRRLGVGWIARSSRAMTVRGCTLT